MTKIIFLALIKIMRQGWFLILLIGWVFSGCSSVHRSHLNSSLAVSLDSCLNANITVDMGQKLTGYASGGYLFHIFRVSGDKRYLDHVRFSNAKQGRFSHWSRVNSVKAAAAYNAVRTSNADVLVNPQYVVEENHWNPIYKWIIVKVTGYAGKISGIKNRPCPVSKN